MFVKISNTPSFTAVLIALLYLVVLLLQLSIHHYDPSYFVDVGEKFVVQAAQVPPNTRVVPNSEGYDGQFYYQLALNPFSPQSVNYGLRIDNGPYRHQRILYPLTVWIFSLGNPYLTPALLLIVNYLSLCALAWLGARYAQLHGYHALWGCLFALFPGFLFTLTHDLTEILAMVFLLAGLISWKSSTSNLQTGLLLAMAALTRETTLLAGFAIGFAIIVSRDYWRWPTVALPLGVDVAWQIGLWAKWGKPPVLTGGLLLGIPGNGIWAFIGSLDLNNVVDRIWAIEIVYLAAVAASAWIAARITIAHLPQKLMWLLSGAMTFAMTRYVWIADVAFLRATTEFYVFSLILILVSARVRLLVPVAIATVVTWMLVFFARLNW